MRQVGLYTAILLEEIGNPYSRFAQDMRRAAIAQTEMMKLESQFTEGHKVMKKKSGKKPKY